MALKPWSYISYLQYWKLHNCPTKDRWNKIVTCQKCVITISECVRFRDLCLLTSQWKDAPVSTTLAFVCVYVCEWKEKHKQKTKICEDEYGVSTAVLQLLSGLRHEGWSIGRDNGGITVHYSPGFKRCCNSVVHKWEKIQNKYKPLCLVLVF